MMSTHDSRLEYKTANGVTIIPYKGDITNIQADGVVTRDDDRMRTESPVTQALMTQYPDLEAKRKTLKKQTNILLVKTPFKLWSVKTTKLSEESKPAKFIFHAIMKQDDDCDNWEENMKKLFPRLLQKAEKREIKVLAVPLLVSSKGNAKSTASVAVKCISDHNPKHLEKVYFISKDPSDVYEIILCCRELNLILVHGNQPDGEMVITRSGEHLPGYEENDTITITYTLPNGTQGDGHPNPGQPYKGTTREAYLPDTKEGREILALLKTAFKRKLTFTIGRSERTGRKNVVKWNGIPHKTNKVAHTRFGYPDSHYLTNLRKDLAQRGITEGESVPDTGYAEQVKGDLENLRKKLTKMNLVVRENGAKGNCMFISLSQQLEHVQNKHTEHREVRQQLVEYLRKKPTTFDGTHYRHFLKIPWETYLKNMATDGHWGDQIMLTAAAKAYNVVIVVIEPNVDEPIKFEPDKHHGSPTDTFYLGFVHGNHYVSLT